MLIEKDKPFYSIVQVAEILGITPDRLRTYDEEKLVFPSRRPKDNKRLYSELDIEWLKNIRFIIAKNKMNIYSFKLLWKILSVLPEREFEKLVKKLENEEIIQIFAKMKSNPNFHIKRK